MRVVIGLDGGAESMRLKAPVANAEEGKGLINSIYSAVVNQGNKMFTHELSNGEMLAFAMPRFVCAYLEIT